MCDGVRFYSRAYKFGNDLKRVSWAVKYKNEDGAYQYGIAERFISVEMGTDVYAFVEITPLNAEPHETYKISMKCKWTAQVARGTAERTYLPLHHLIRMVVFLLFVGETDVGGSQVAHLIEGINIAE
jgi:hypothetical protein